MSKADAIAACGVADEALYQVGFADGVASVSSPSGDVTAAQEQLDIAAAVSAAVGPLNDQISALQLAKGQEDALLASVKDAAAKLLASLG